jgi:hypothetical protein
MFGRYSFADFLREGPTAFGAGGGPELVSLGGTSDVRNQSLAYGFDYTVSPTMVADFRFGWFRYRVNVLPFDFGSSTATDAGVPGLNISGDDFTSGLFAGFIDRRPEIICSVSVPVWASIVVTARSNRTNSKFNSSAT